MSYTFPNSPYYLATETVRRPKERRSWLRRLHPIDFFTITVSVLSAAASTFQYFENEKGQPIAAAIEASNKYLSERIDAITTMELYKLGESGSEEISKVIVNLDKLQYIAELSSKGKINTDYLSSLVICDIVNLAKNENQLSALVKIKISTREFARTHYKDECVSWGIHRQAE